MKLSAAGRGLAGVMAACVVVLTGCSSEPAGSTASAPGDGFTAPLPAGLQPVASVLDLMLDPIDTHADALWEAVATVSTIEGTRDEFPQSDEEWDALRRKAVVLMEASNLLVVEGRPVAHPGQKIKGAGESTDYTPEQAEAEIRKDPAAFAAFAASMQGASRQLVEAIDARSVEQYLDAGSQLQEACEGCHRRFWYPNSPLPPGLE